MARHKPVSKARWLISQKHLSESWHAEDLLANELERVKRYHLPLLLKHHPDIDEKTSILDLCCGPVCTARLLPGSERTYLDPLLDTYRRLYPGKLPKGRHVPLAAEKIPERDKAFDIILCINGLDHVLNPELTLNEIERLLAPDGTLLLSLSVFPPLIVRLRYFFERFFSPLRDDAHPYSYSLAALERSLSRHFEIIERLPLNKASAAESRTTGEEYAFVCKPRTTGKKEPAIPPAQP